ncbi:DUF6119 family protein [Pontibacillus salipaludis]|uniref:Sporadically distributed protein, TIGR04141 family n=1 Tax=Pontibacillus salipaludis TaxID=1697394 RepID=A0ABQ1QKJ1_9BACI|nr:DUF6119 family protein [Pontibacillus salipaludis]GGD29691.1 hypothetical protein GCM10011389_41570 [Pontibacillus salipaludis]
MAKNKNLTIYLMNQNKTNFKKYLREEYQDKIQTHYINKRQMSSIVEKGIIFVYEDKLPMPEWVDYLNTLSSKKSLKIAPKKTHKAIVFLTIKGQSKKTFALTFGHGSSLLDSEFIVHDFGLSISKSLLDINEINSIDSTSIDRKIFNTKKQSSTFLIREKLLEYGSQNIVKNVHGVYRDFEDKFSIGGNESLNFKGKIDLISDLNEWLSTFASLYDAGENNLGIDDDLTVVSDEIKEILDKRLTKKILTIISTANITKRQISPLKIFPNETFELSNFYGFFIEGLGYKSGTSFDFNIDELSFFQRLKRQLSSQQKTHVGVLKKLKSNHISKKVDEEGSLEKVCTIYKAINYEITYNSNKYILVAGNWFEIDKEFYSKLQKDIDKINKPTESESIRFITFDSDKHFKMVSSGTKKQLSEGAYNEDLAFQNRVLMLDRANYMPDSQTVKQYGLTSTPIELCDVLYFNKHKIQFIHVKRHSGAAGTSHLLTQALVSAHAFINDHEKVVQHINEKIDAFNHSSEEYGILKNISKSQSKEIILAIIDKDADKQKSNSNMLSILEMVSLRENVKQLEYLGFKVYLQFIPSNE